MALKLTPMASKTTRFSTTIMRCAIGRSIKFLTYHFDSGVWVNAKNIIFFSRIINNSCNVRSLCIPYCWVRCEMENEQFSQYVDPWTNSGWKYYKVLHCCVSYLIFCPRVNITWKKVIFVEHRLHYVINRMFYFFNAKFSWIISLISIKYSRVK